MAQTCSICSDSRRVTVDRDLLRVGQSVRGVAEQYGFSSSATQRHKSKCLAQRIQRAAGARIVQEVRATFAYQGEIEWYYAQAKAWYVKLRDDAANHPRDVTGALKAAGEALELVGRATGELVTGERASNDKSDAELLETAAKALAREGAESREGAVH
jgi:hypothetical protein